MVNLVFRHPEAELTLHSQLAALPLENRSFRLLQLHGPNIETVFLFKRADVGSRSMFSDGGSAGGEEHFIASVADLRDAPERTIYLAGLKRRLDVCSRRRLQVEHHLTLVINPLSIGSDEGCIPLAACAGSHRVPNCL